MSVNGSAHTDTKRHWLDGPPKEPFDVVWKKNSEELIKKNELRYNITIFVCALILLVVAILSIYKLCQ